MRMSVSVSVSVRGTGFPRRSLRGATRMLFHASRSPFVRPLSSFRPRGRHRSRDSSYDARGLRDPRCAARKARRVRVSQPRGMPSPPRRNARVRLPNPPSLPRALPRLRGTMSHTTWRRHATRLPRLLLPLPSRAPQEGSARGRRPRRRDWSCGASWRRRWPTRTTMRLLVSRSARRLSRSKKGESPHHPARPVAF